MIGILLLSSSFMIIILISILVLTFHIKRWTTIKEEEAQKRFEELTKRIDQTQALFKNEVTHILKNISNILPHKDDNTKY